MNMAFLRRGLLLGLAATLVGCATEPEIQLHEVEGTVLMNGEPLDKIYVQFWPADNGPRSADTTDEQGRFVLQTYGAAEEKKGAIASRHKVVLTDSSVFKEGAEKLTPSQKRGMDLTSGKKPRIANKYANIATTPLEVEITGPTKDIQLEVDPYAG